MKNALDIIRDALAGIASLARRAATPTTTTADAAPLRPVSVRPTAAAPIPPAVAAAAEKCRAKDKMACRFHGPLIRRAMQNAGMKPPTAAPSPSPSPSPAPQRAQTATEPPTRAPATAAAQSTAPSAQRTQTAAPSPQRQASTARLSAVCSRYNAFNAWVKATRAQSRDLSDRLHFASPAAFSLVLMGAPSHETRRVMDDCTRAHLKFCALHARAQAEIAGGGDAAEPLAACEAIVKACANDLKPRVTAAYAALAKDIETAPVRLRSIRALARTLLDEAAQNSDEGDDLSHVYDDALEKTPAAVAKTFVETPEHKAYVSARDAFYSTQEDINELMVEVEADLAQDRAPRATKKLEELTSRQIENIETLQRALEASMTALGRLADKRRRAAAGASQKGSPSAPVKPSVNDGAAPRRGETAAAYAERRAAEGRPIPATVANFQAKVDRHEKAWKRTGIPFGVSKAELQTFASTVDANSDKAAFCADWVVDQFMRNGHFKGLLETTSDSGDKNEGIGGGYTDKKMRARFTRNAFGNPASERALSRKVDVGASAEKYGALLGKSMVTDWVAGASGYTTTEPPADLAASCGYVHHPEGGACIRFRPGRVCCTATIGDSLVMCNSMGEKSRYLQYRGPSLLTDFSITSCQDEEKLARLIRSGRYGRLNGEQVAKRFGQPYFELQYHGMVTPDCVESINFKDAKSLKNISPEGWETIRANDIAVYVNGRPWKGK